ncbi:MAG: sigma 54-interacting transcriptional regulator [Deltaproteobacteria bacterium]|nr:sigma 54-interacting transcriptional regulator [Deltaproteobacteria bacterium]
MVIDENEFFRQATMLICGSLDIEKALTQILPYLARVMPVDAIHLHLYEPNLGAIRTIAEVTRTGARSLEKITSLTKEGRDSFRNGRVPNVRIVNRFEEDPVVARIAASLRTQGSSTLLMRLVVEQTRLGTLALTAEGKDRYTEEHARLLSLLNEPCAIALANALQHEEVVKLKERLADDNRYLHQELFRMSGDEIVGGDFGLRETMEMVRQVAPLESPVLLLGETGVGKGVIANAIHYSSPRRKGPFITVNSGAIPEALIDSELFGHERGAFTGAIEQKRGRFERANHGTIFLDEVGELPPQAQIRMLRVLQEKEIERVGGSKAIPVDIRIIAATHRNLRGMVRAGQFREDLWFRLNVFPIEVPPLRDRKEDIPSLLHHFLGKKSYELKLPAIPDLAPGALDRLMGYAWPGNVRELENVVERELILNRGELLNFKTVAEGDDEAGRAAETSGLHRTLSLDAVGANHIRRVLKMAGGVVHGPGGAAALLGINPSTLRSRMKKLGISYGRKSPG